MNILQGGSPRKSMNGSILRPRYRGGRGVPLEKRGKRVALIVVIGDRTIAAYLQGQLRVGSQLRQKAPLIIHFRRRNPDRQRHSQIVGESQRMGLVKRTDGVQALRRGGV